MGGIDVYPNSDDVEIINFDLRGNEVYGLRSDPGNFIKVHGNRE
jgi:hypothetical protein